MKTNLRGLKRKLKKAYGKAKKDYVKSKPLRRRTIKRARTLRDNINYYFSN